MQLFNILKALISIKMKTWGHKIPWKFHIIHCHKVPSNFYSRKPLIPTFDFATKPSCCDPKSKTFYEGWHSSYDDENHGKMCCSYLRWIYYNDYFFQLVDDWVWIWHICIGYKFHQFKLGAMSHYWGFVLSCICGYNKSYNGTHKWRCSCLHTNCWTK